MKVAKVLAIAGTLIMFFTLANGFITGDFLKEGGILFSMAWGKVSLIDVYIGFFLFSAWVLYREEKWIIALLWIISIMILGNFVTCLYAAIALYKSEDNFKRFWLGHHFNLHNEYTTN